MRIPITWPEGTYGLPMPKSGCPKRSNFPWDSGYRYHDTEDRRSNNMWSSPFDLAGPYYKNNMYQNFCMKKKTHSFCLQSTLAKRAILYSQERDMSGRFVLFVCFFVFSVCSSQFYIKIVSQLDCLDSPWG